MQKIKYFTRVYHSVLFFCSKNVRLNYLIMKINHRKESQNVAINHSADIDYNDFVKIYKECTLKTIFFCDN